MFLKPAFLTGLLAVNILTFVWYFTVSNANDTTSPRQELIEMLSDDLNLNMIKTIYFYLNRKRIWIYLNRNATWYQ